MTATMSDTQTTATRPASLGMALTAVILGTVGILFGLIPLTSPIALFFGVLGSIFALVAWVKHNRRGWTIAGTIASTLALILAVWGLVTMTQATDKLVTDLNEIAGTSTSAPATTSATAKNALTLKWGESADIGDITYTVTKPVAHTVSEYQAADKPGPAMSMKVTMKNNGEKTEGTFGAMFNATLPDKACEPLFDSAAGLEGDPSVDLLPGRSTTWPVGFMCAADAPGLVVQGKTLMGSGKALWAS